MTSKEWFDKICDKLELKGYSFTNIGWFDDPETTWHNYCVYFRVKECKKWRFGFIFGYNKDTNDVQDAMFFAKHNQSESMKPSQSCHKSKITNIGAHSDSFFFEYMSVMNVLDSIKYHPIIAYYREMCNDDFSDRKSILYRLIDAKRVELIHSLKVWYYSKYNFNHGCLRMCKIKRRLLKYNDLFKVELRDWNKLIEETWNYPRYELNIYFSDRDTEGWDMMRCLYKPSGKQRWSDKYCHIHYFNEETVQIFPRVDDELLEDVYGWRFRLRRWFKNVLHR